MKKYDITHYSTHSEIKCSIGKFINLFTKKRLTEFYLQGERLIRTLKSRIYKEMSYHNDDKWTKYLQKCTKDYNNTVHSTIHMKPVDVKKSHEKMLLKSVYNYEMKLGEAKYKKGDLVRVSRSPKLFQKGYKFLWTAEVFKIYKINRKIPVTYILQDENNEIIDGRFYEQVFFFPENILFFVI
jgi:hypothetical protein